MTKILIFCGVLYLLAFATVWALRGAFIYPLDPQQNDPDGIDLSQVTEQIVQTPDDKQLVVWTHPPKSDQPTLIYFHGNAGNLAGRANRFRILSERGFGFVALAYRGSGGSSGKPSERAITADSRLILKQAQTGAFGWVPDQIIYYGESIGSGVSVKLAKHVQPDALILEAPFTSVVDRAADQMWMFPVRPILDERWESTHHIQQVTAPLLVLHGSKDQVTPIENGKRLFAAAPMSDKQFVELDGVGHQVWTEEGQEALFDYLKRF